MTDANDFEMLVPDLTVGGVRGLTQGDVDTLLTLLAVWNEKRPRNQLRTEYYNAHERVRNLRIAVPDRLADKVTPVVGWPAKAVTELAALSQYQGVDAPTGAEEARQIARASHLDRLLPQAIVSCYKHSCAFLTVHTVADGTPRITPRSALMSSALWDTEEQKVKAALTVTGIETDRAGRQTVTGIVLWLPGVSYRVQRDESGGWRARAARQTWPGVNVVPIAHDPQLDRPFGRSRITRPLMAYTDMAIRTLLRQEATSEFYSAPHLWFLGASKDALSADTWTSLVSAINGIGKDVDGDTPTLQQVSQATMEPHSAMLRTIAMLVSSETDIPVSDLGVTMDNPASAESMMEAERKLSRTAERQNMLFSDAVRDALGIAWCAAHDQAAPPAQWGDVGVAWGETREISLAARADYYTKISSVWPGFASTRVGRRMAGLTDAQIDSAQADEKAAQTQDVLQQVFTPAGGRETEGADNADDEADTGGRGGADQGV